MSYDEAAAGENQVDESLMILQQLEDKVKHSTEELRDLKGENRQLQGKLGGFENWKTERETLLVENTSLKEKISVIEERIKNILSRLEDSPDEE